MPPPKRNKGTSAADKPKFNHGTGYRCQRRQHLNPKNLALSVPIGGQLYAPERRGDDHQFGRITRFVSIA